MGEPALAPLGPWDLCLDELEADLDRLAAAVQDGLLEEEPTWEPPGHLPHPSPRERDRARELLARLEAATSLLRDARDRVAAELGRTQERRAAAHAYGVTAAVTAP